MGLLPFARRKRIYDIDLEFLLKNNISHIFVDLDNTLAPWHSLDVPEETFSWVEKVKKQGIKIIILTNSRKKNADIIADKLGIGVYKDARKPFKAATKKLMKRENICSDNVLFVGDQLFTDIALANSLNAKSVLTEPLSKKEWWCTKVFNRSREKLVWNFLFKD